MDDRIGRLVACVGVERTAAKQAVLSIAQFPPMHGHRGTKQSAKSPAALPELGHSPDV
jgi:hypothetical protein